MSIFDAQYARQKHDLSWGEDYFLGLISRTEPITYSRILDLVTKQEVMANPTMNRYLKKLVEKNLVEKKPDEDDQRLVYFCTTKEGKQLIKEIRDAVK